MKKRCAEVIAASGLFAGLSVMIVYIFILSDYDLAVAGFFLNAAAALIVFGGTVAAVYAAFPASVVAESLRSAALVFTAPKGSGRKSAERLAQIAETAARDGALALEETAAGTGDPFLRKGLTLVIDGAPPEDVRAALEAELRHIDARWAGKIRVWGFIAGTAPAWGMIGAFAALAVTAARPDDPAAAGGLMATALAAVLYGAVIAYLLAKPVAERLRTLAERELAERALEIKGILAIRAGEGPRTVEERLKALL